jgi:hypothetical protein
MTSCWRCDARAPRCCCCCERARARAGVWALLWLCEAMVGPATLASRHTTRRTHDTHRAWDCWALKRQLGHSEESTRLDLRVHTAGDCSDGGLTLWGRGGAALTGVRGNRRYTSRAACVWGVI